MDSSGAQSKSSVVSRDQAWIPLAGLVAVYALSIVLPMPAHDGRILELPSICPFNEMTGLPCPGCGLTRAFVCIAHGHLVEAVHWHPLSPLLFILGIIALCDAAARVFANRTVLPVASRWRSRATWTGAGVFLAYGIARAAYFAFNHLRF